MGDKSGRGGRGKGLDRNTIIAEIVQRLGAGEPLAQICRENRMPDDSTVRDWMAEDPVIALAIARGREAGFDVLASSTLEISDGDATDEDTAVAVARDKLKIETRLKLLSKWDPKRYGDRLEVDSKLSGTVAIVLTPEQISEAMRRSPALASIGRS